MAVPVVAVRGRQLVQFRLVPDEHVLGAGRPVVGEARGRRRRRRAGASTAAAASASAASRAAAARAASSASAAAADAAVVRGDPSAPERRLLLLVVIGPVDGDVHAGHEADAGLFLLGLYPAAAAPAIPPAAARHQRRGPPPDDGHPVRHTVVPDSRRSRQRIGLKRVGRRPGAVAVVAALVRPRTLSLRMRTQMLQVLMLMMLLLLWSVSRCCLHLKNGRETPASYDGVL